MRDITKLAAASALLLAVAACGDDGVDTEAAEDCSGPPEVTVRETGAEPRRMMEASPTAGDTAALDMHMTQATSYVVDGQATPTQDGPPMVIGMVMEVTSATGDEIEMAFTYDRAEAEGGDESVDEILESLSSMSGTMTTTRTGEFVSGSIDTEGFHPALASVTGQLEQQLADMTMPLPGEPVGVGAEWDVTSSVQSEGITFCNTAAYHLTQFDGDAYELDIDVTQLAKPATLQDGATTVELMRGSGASTGQSSGRLSFPLAVAGSVRGSTLLELAVEQDGDRQTQEVEITIDVELIPRD
jgi:hypothetical protein